ncbi:aminotransferase class I/II-fold pyridoxal phosphate-dependent enzyme [Virgibacillus sp. W0430]|uniref:aminotransferase class I/II-fold pyridoxal phosphate-dependent enzyme n=1 Tax=Virgibacillus sp. W0430 TaxID=3391580 RepID=UPI003F460B33
MRFVSEKVQRLPEYLFSEFQRKKKVLQKNGVDVIDLGIGAPDLSPPQFIIDELFNQSKNTANHRYSPFSGCDEFKQAVAHFYEKRYGVNLDPDTEVLALIGSKEGIANLVHAVINPEDIVLIPDPGYPVYKAAVHLAGGKAVSLPLDKENEYVPQFNQISEQVAEKAKVMFLNYPANPTAATVELPTFESAVLYAETNNILLAHDAAYDLITFNSYKAPSVLQVTGAKKYAVEFGSLSKSFNMTGWRIGYVVGNKEVIQALATLKSNIDTSQYVPIQKAAAVALNSDLQSVSLNNDIYVKRMETLYNVLGSLGMRAQRPKGTIFVWAEVPEGFSSLSFANYLLDEAGVIVTPGSAFGKNGEGFVRIALTVTEERLKEAVLRLQKLNIKEVDKN